MAKEKVTAKEQGVNPINAFGGTRKPRVSKVVVRDSDGNWVNVKVTYSKGDMGEKLQRLRDMGYDVSKIRYR